MLQEESKPESEGTSKIGTSEDCGHGVHSCTCPPDKDYVKFTKIRGLTHLVGLINFMPPFDSPISYKPLERMWSLKKQIKEIDPNWLLADEITL
jgi:hypothetical protein